jgi:hypothetical protein
MKNIIKCNAESLKEYLKNYGWNLSSQKAYAPAGGTILTFTGGSYVPENLNTSCNSRIEKGISELTVYLWR